MLALTLATIALAAAPVKVAPDHATVIAASSGPGQNTALALSDRRVVFQDVRGRWHRFAVGSGPVRFARLGGGAGLAAWERGGAVFVREWHRNGKLDAPKALLNGIDAWTMGADRRGTVVVAAMGAGDAVYASLRDPGESFGPVQQLRAPQPPAQYPVTPVLAVSPITANGTVTVSWGTGHATRGGGEFRFGAPQPGSGLAPVPAGRLAVDDNAPVSEGPRLRALCGCTDARLFTWGASRAVAVKHDGAWYLAKRSGSRYDRPKRVSRDGAAFPVWTAKPGVLAFTRSTKTGVYLTR